MGNIVLNKTATAASFVVPYAPQKAVDGSVTPFSRWLCNATPGWLKVDPGAWYMVNRWVIRHLPVAGWDPNYVISDYRLQGSNDNNSWSDIDSVAGNTASVTDRPVPPVVFRYFRVYVTRGLKNNNQMISLMEFELYQAYSSQLANLTLSAGTLTPAFNPSTVSYTATVPDNVASINVTPTTKDPQAVVKVNGTVVQSGQPAPVNLAYGANTITVNVTDGTGAQTNYVVTVTRQMSAYLSSLTAQTRGGSIALTPPFAPTTPNYSANVANGVTSVTFTPTAENPSVGITINGTSVPSGQTSPSFTLIEGNNTFTITVTSTTSTFTYTVTIVRAYNLLLTQAIIAYNYRGGSGTMTVTMDSTNLNYSAALPNNPSNMTIAPYAASPAVVVKVNGTVVPSGTPSASMTVTSGMVVSITVSTPDNSQTRSYTVTVTK